MNGQNTKKKGNGWIGLLMVLIFLQPTVFIPLAIVGGSIYLIVKTLTRNSASTTSSARTYTKTQYPSGKTTSRTVTQTTTRYTTRQERFDNCDQGLFCRHDDKAVHHVRRGKEIDPWDRPDIDISKYQRKG